MQAEDASERVSHWERHDPCFRVHIFSGAPRDVTVIELRDIAVDTAFNLAQALSNGDEQLWALALVERDAQGLPGIIWLSGMDYNVAPSSPRERLSRQHMQDRYLMAKSLRGEAPVLPDGLRVIRLFPEWSRGWPIWESFTEAYRLTGEDLGLTSELSRSLFSWNEEWLARELNDPLPTGWEEHGHELVQRLRAELEGVAEVRPDFMDHLPSSPSNQAGAAGSAGN